MGGRAQVVPSATLVEADLRTEQRLRCVLVTVELRPALARGGAFADLGGVRHLVGHVDALDPCHLLEVAAALRVAPVVAHREREA